MTEEQFEIQVSSERYFVQPSSNESNSIKYKVSTLCDYMFTLELDDNANWLTGKDVIALDNDLINQIGNAIEKHQL
jgi:hypothetical protein